MERYSALRIDEAFCLHLLGPHLVVCGDYELRVGKTRLQQPAKLLAVILFDGHDHVVKHGDAETAAQQPLHQSKVQTHAYSVLMALTVIGPWREHAAVVEGYFEIELAFSRFELRLELALVVTVDLTIEVAEVVLDGRVKLCHMFLRDVAVGCVGELPDLRHILGSLLGSPRLPVTVHTVLR